MPGPPVEPPPTPWVMPDPLGADPAGVVAVGADLEVGWLPAAIQSASNPRILPGQPGYFEGAIEAGLAAADQAVAWLRA